jgi:TM2 domain-containing membrane protein YozV
MLSTMASSEHDQPADDTRACPLCGESIKRVAIRCKHCHGDLTTLPVADFDRGAAAKAAPSPVLTDVEFEQRFLEYAYQTMEPITAISVAYALKVPIAFADDRLEALAAADVLRRDVDDEGTTTFALPGRPRALTHSRPGHAISPRTPSEPPSEAAATAGLVLNLCFPGLGSIVAGKPRAGVAQLALLLVGIPLMFVYIGFPMIFGAWVWGLVTSGNALQEARQLDAPAVGSSTHALPGAAPPALPGKRE